MEQITARPGKVACQVVGGDNQGLRAQIGTSAFVTGEVFSQPELGNKVKFYTTGDEYFKEVATAIENAKQCIFIAGWQVNFDVVLNGEKRLIDCLKTAVHKNNCSVYVMPWLSPKIGVNTHDLETMLAVFQLNAGLSGPPKAIAMPAMQQSDMGNLGIMFSHHQKCVVIDNQFAFVGGIDLAYGRRDDEKFSLVANSEGRKGNEMYNPCVPPLYEIGTKRATYLSTIELIFAALMPKALTSVVTKPVHIAGDVINNPVIEAVQDWWNDPAFMDQATLFGAEAEKKLCESWLGVLCGPNPVKEAINNAKEAANKIVTDAQEKAADAATSVAVAAGGKAYRRLPSEVQRYIKTTWETNSAMVRDEYGMLMAWLNNASLDSLPENKRNQLHALVRSLVVECYRILSNEKNWTTRSFPYALTRNLVPKGGKELNHYTQPRMPWQDVQARLEGPAVYHLARNFIQRWNSTQHQMMQDSDRNANALNGTSEAVRHLVSIAGARSPLIAHYVSAKHLPKKSAPGIGKCKIQVLRSASRKLVQEENAALKPKEYDALNRGDAWRQTDAIQDNILNATLKAINSAQDFIYIEGQFFQSEFGDQVVSTTEFYSGPMNHQLSFTSLPGYNEYKDIFKLEQAEEADDPAALIEWGKIFRAKKALLEKSKDAKEVRKDFIDGLSRILANKAQILGFNALSKPQKKMLNNIGKKLAERISRAIIDERPFHVYMVLPVHPEGTLDTVTIMTQVHLTMQSLVHGKNSLVNRIKEAIAANEVRKREGVLWNVALEKARAQDLAKGVKDEAWQEYLTLLNLRNWATVGVRTFTEQIYVHSKLMIVDDRIAILGSANINDRSMLGDRDSELAIMIHDEEQVQAPIRGHCTQPVSKEVHELRKSLWEKHFGLKAGGSKAASDLKDCLDKPADPITWKLIQKRARDNQQNYESAFKHIPRSDSTTNKGQDDKPRSASIWPTWEYEDPQQIWPMGKQISPMPFQETFWTTVTKIDANLLAGVKGFITALPIKWTQGENNDSLFNLTVLSSIKKDQMSPFFHTAEGQPIHIAQSASVAENA